MNTTTDKIKATIASLVASENYPYATTASVYDAARANGFTYASAKETFMQPQYASGRGTWNISIIDPNNIINTISKKSAEDQVEPQRASSEMFQRTAVGAVQSVSNDTAYIPESDSTFIPWGEYHTIYKIINSRSFYPLYISGMSGNGKTMMVEQACAKCKREYVRVQISPETDEDDLLGGFRLVNGETVFQKGPVIKAMERGAVLLIDEIDRGSNKIMCLQGVLEGKPILIKKTGETIKPSHGFTVMATANTKGRGSEDGRYVAAQIIDEAFIERFVASIDQPYPEYATELKIVKKHMQQYNCMDEKFAEFLVSWSSVIRVTYEAEGVDEVISTRRLCHIVKSFSIFRDRMDSIKMCINRFENETREAFLDLYSKIDASNAGIPTADPAQTKPNPVQNPF